MTVTTTLEVILGDGTELVNEPIPPIHRRDGQRQYFLNTRETFTPQGIPVSFIVDIGPRGQGLTVNSAGLKLLSVFPFDLLHGVTLRLASDELLDIRLNERRKR